MPPAVMLQHTKTSDMGASRASIPFEQVFAKLKNTLRKMARNRRCTLGIALDDLSPEECFNYFRNAGYAST